MNNRQTAILRLLYKNSNYMTYAEIAEQVNASLTTVRNDIAAIKASLDSANAGTIETKPHIGIRLVRSDSEALQKLENKNEDTDRDIFFFILRYLFKKDTLTAQKLAQRYYLSRSSTDRIVEQAHTWFSENRIVFERRRGKGISIKYSEFNYRAAFVNFAAEFADLLSKSAPQRVSPSPLLSDADYTAVCAALDGFDASPAAAAVTALEREFGIRFDCLSGLRLTLMLSLCILRCRKGHAVQMPQLYSCPVSGDFDKIMAERLTQMLESRFGLTFPESEREFIEFAAAVSEISEFDSEDSRRRMEVMNIGLCRLTVKSANLISEIAGVDLRDDKFFIRHLFLQLKVTTARLRYGIAFRNRLLGMIKAKYPNMMAAAWLLGNVFEKELSLEINEHEVGFLALHIGGAIERRLSAVSACIVCDYGIGISQLLREKINRAIPELRTTGVFSARDMRSIKSDPCDFIITTVPLDGYHLNRDAVTVGHLLSTADISTIESEMKTVEKTRRGNLQKILPSKTLFHRDLIFPHCKAKDKDELLHFLCTHLEIGGYVTEKFEKSVFERESSTSTGIGNGIAIPHGLSEYVNCSAAVFASLDKPIDWDGEDAADAVFLLAFDLNEDEDVKADIIEFYKSVVSLTEDNVLCRRLKELTDKDELMEILELR